MTTLSTFRTRRAAPAVAAAIALVASACASEAVIARDTSDGGFAVGSPCDPHAFPDCGWTDLDCDARTRVCVRSNACSSDADCSDLFACRTGIHSCAVACFGDDYCKKGSRCDPTSAVCVDADAGSAADAGGRSCPSECFGGHQCCAGSCAGPAVSMPSDCCSCLPGEVSSATCGGHCG